ncbi:DUF2637 domain-containing protein [Nocardia rhizosphaerihabitans]|uniref:DUF2637 domain-containing protein n=1 Tax=Nocardia rhizosphaerihabitans TaxID=1691570 RepID=UPI00166B60C3|nr:DUF2637 domain-containing protein [Nocardia rhizosphaerihabitans]
MPTASSQTVRTEPTTRVDVRADRAHIFFWSELCIAAGVSVVGNATQAVLHTTVLPAVAAAVAVIPPLALLAAVHGVALLARANTVSPTARRAATALTVVIAGGAFWLSFTALRALAITAGVPVAEAWLWPLIVEGAMTQSSIALLTLAHAHPPDTRPEPAAAVPDPQPPAAQSARPGVAAELPATQTEASEMAGKSRDDPLDVVDLEALAALICDQDPGGRRDPVTVAAVLTHRYVDGWSASRVSRELGCSRSAVSRLLRDADRLRAHVPADRAHTDAGLTAKRAHDGNDRAHTDSGRAHAKADPRGDRAHAESERAHADHSPADTEASANG